MIKLTEAFILPRQPSLVACYGMWFDPVKHQIVLPILVDLKHPVLQSNTKSDLVVMPGALKIGVKKVHSIHKPLFPISMRIHLFPFPYLH